jgi:hypothetical protein
MKKLLIIIMVLFFMVVGAAALDKGNDASIAATCFLKGARISGVNKICYYDRQYFFRVYGYDHDM